MTNERQRLGRYGEGLARRHLETNGYAILDANYRTKHGEIDLIAQRGGQLVFVEVRTRKATAFGTPEESVTPRKRQRLVAVSEAYLQAAGAEGTEWRIDVIAVVVDRLGRLVRLDVVENAVESQDLPDS